MFKQEWEKTRLPFTLDEYTIREMVTKALPDEILQSWEIISGGCANLNIKLFLNHNRIYILRVYIREKEAAFREQKIAELLKDKVPVPNVYFIGAHEELRFALVEYMPGITLRELLLNPQGECKVDLMYQAGQILASFTDHRYVQAGFFDAQLKVVPHSDFDVLQSYIWDVLQQSQIIQKIGLTRIDKIRQFIKVNKSSFPDESAACLVHGDYDPANILVDKVNGKWQITAVLDWEFTFSGSWLWDVSNMLRYANKMPAWFTQSFIQGITDYGLIMPDNWPLTINLLNLTSLLGCLVHSNSAVTINKDRDIIERIDSIVDI